MKISPGKINHNIDKELNPYPNITKLIEEDILDTSQKMVQDFQLIRAKNGVYVYRCNYGGIPAVVKYLEKESDRREILNYQILAQCGIPTIKIYAMANASIVMEDISLSEDWRLGEAKDLDDTDVSKSLAHWYFIFHERGINAPGLNKLYFEYDRITKDSLNMLLQKFPEAKEVFEFILCHYDRLQKLIYKPSFTLTYNDFYWVNFIVRKDKKEAIMFDYNLLGKGYRFSDFRNVCWSMSNDAKSAFVGEYNRLHLEKHGHTRTEAENLEQIIDDVASELFTLIVAFADHENEPGWVKDSKENALSGALLAKARACLLCESICTSSASVQGVT